MLPGITRKGEPKDSALPEAPGSKDYDPLDHRAGRGRTRTGCATMLFKSMTDSFGHTDALEPAFAVLNQVLRRNENIGVVLKDRHTTFLCLAQSFQANSHIDRDGEGKQKEKLTFSRYRRQSSDREVARLRKRNRPYHQGFCYDFQKKSFCSKRHCALKHQCAICRSKRHGKAACSR